MGRFCLQSRRTGMYVVRQYDGRVLVFKSRLRAWAFKTRRFKWHWAVVPEARAAAPVAEETAPAGADDLRDG